MSRINAKRLLLLAMAVVTLAVSAGAAWAQEDIISGDQLTPEQVNYKTETVITGTFEKKGSGQCSQYYPYKYKVRCEYGGTKFLDSLSTVGDEVTEGMVVAELSVESSPVYLTNLERTLQRTEEAFEKGVKQREEAIVEARAAIAGEQDRFEKEKKTIALRRMEIELEQYSYTQQYNIDQQKETLEKEYSRLNATQLIAPVNGFVSDSVYKRAYDDLYVGEELATISSTDVMLMRVDNTNMGLRYNMPVVVTMGPNKKRVEVTGRVVAADNMLPENQRTGYAYIELDEDWRELDMRNPTAMGYTISLENVTLVPRKTVTLENGKYFVSKLVDGMVQKRYVTYGLGGATALWIMDGLEEGEILVVD